MRRQPWVTQRSAPDKLLELRQAFGYDMGVRQNRYEYVEALVRCLPGKFGAAVRAIVLKGFFARFGHNVVLWPGSRIRFPYRLEVGNNVAISFDCILQAGGGISIGDNTLLGPGVKVWSVNHMFKDVTKTINIQGYEGRSVIIGADCWIGSNSFIKPGTEIPDGCVVLPGTVLGRMKIPPYTVVSGNPAQIIGPRNRVGAIMGWGAVER